MFFSPTKITGELTLCLRGPNGHIKSRDTFKNLVVNTGQYHIANLMSAGAEAAMSHMAISTGGVAQDYTDTELTAPELFRKACSITQGTGANANKIFYSVTLAPTEGTGTLREAGIFNSSIGGVMLCRTAFADRVKGAGDSLTLTWAITINS